MNLHVVLTWLLFCSSCSHTWDAFQLANASFQLYCVRNNYVFADNNQKNNSKLGPRLLGEAPKIAVSPPEREVIKDEDLSDTFSAIKIYDEHVEMRFLVCGVPCTLVGWYSYDFLVFVFKNM